jgi:hypothetical protein
MLCFLQLDQSHPMIREKLIPFLEKYPQFRQWLSFVYYVLGDIERGENYDIDSNSFADLRGVTQVFFSLSLSFSLFLCLFVIYSQF